MRYSFEHEGKIKGFYEFNHFPGNNQIVVSNHTFVNKEWRGNGAGKVLMREKNQRAIDLGFDYMISTVVSSNECMVKLAKYNGYKELDRMTNRESGNEVIIFGKSLREEK